MKCRARSSRFAFGIPVSSSGKATLSTTLRQGNVDSSWNTMPIDLCGPEMVSPPTRTVPACCASRPPITLNKVDLPQPEGPMIERNSPCRTLNETLSTAVTGPSAVSNRTATSSAVRIASAAALRVVCSMSVALAGHRGGHHRGITGLHAHVDDGQSAGLARGDRLFEHTGQIADCGDRSERGGALRSCHRGEVDVRLGNLLADPAVLDRPAAHARDALLMQLVIEEGAVVGDHEQQWDLVVRRGPERGHAH